jgi:thiol-disulfide isomerase/thioredoxin
MYSPYRAVMPGKMVPDFRFVSIDNPDVVYTRESMMGKYYMIDFWAVWCGPCRAEMPGLHAAYEKFHGPNFEIISLSFDPTPDKVAKYREDKYPMPWLHSFIDGGFDSEAAEAFEVAGIPKPVLVGPDGTIVATESELRGENLEKTLAKYLGSGSGEQLGENR